MRQYMQDDNRVGKRLFYNLKIFLDIFNASYKFIMAFFIALFLVIIFNYLKKIDRLSIMVDVAREPMTLLVALFSILSLILILFMGALGIIMVGFEANNIIDNHKNTREKIFKITKRSYFFMLFGNIFSVIILFVYSFLDLDGLSFVITIILFYGFLRECFIQKIMYDKQVEKLTQTGYKVKFLKKYMAGYLFLIFVANMLIFSSLISFSMLMVYILEHKNNFYLLLSLSIFLYFLFIAIFMIFSMKYIKKEENVDWGAVIIAPLSAIFYFLFFYTDFGFYSLYAVRFIEKPKDSSWYLIHNGNATSDTINGMIPQDILGKKVYFNNKNCNNNDWCKDDVSMTLEKRENALYGYMAWNLGSTKVFCPPSVNFFDNSKDNQEQAKFCFAIDGKYLQLVSGKLLSKD